MAKIPDELKVKFTVSDIAIEVPKPLFEGAAIKVAIFFGRKGKGALTRRTKWFTLADPSLVEWNIRQVTALAPSGDGTGHDSAEASVKTVPTELSIIKFGGLNDVIYDTELTPLNKYDGEWVFDQKLTHPVTVFAKVFIRMRAGAVANAAKSEQESNLNDMLQMDQSEMDDDFSDGDDGGRDANEDSRINIEGVQLTTDQLALLTDGKSENELLIEDLKLERNCKKRYLPFPKTIDLATVANTRAKHLEFSERLNCKSASLLGTVVSFNITAEVDEHKLAQYESKKKDKEDREERKRREKEEKVLEKEREKERRKQEKERKKHGGKGTDMYGCDITETGDGAAAPTATEVSTNKAPETYGKQKTGFAPFNKIKGIFASKEKHQSTPFPIKAVSTPYPYLFLLDSFVLKKLVMPPEFYRGVHIHLATDPAELDGFPMLLLTTDNKSYLKEATVNGYDGKSKNVFRYEFGNLHVYCGDKHIRNITGFDTIRALTESEKNYAKAKKRAEENPEEAVGGNDHQSAELFHSEILKVGEKFQPIAFQATKYSANEAQVESVKFTRVMASLVVPKDVKNVDMITDEQEKAAYLESIKREQKSQEKELKKKEKEMKRAEEARERAEKKAEKERLRAEKTAKGKDTESKSESESSASEEDESTSSGDDEHNTDNNSDVPEPAVEHNVPCPTGGDDEAAGGQGAEAEVIETALESSDAGDAKNSPKTPKEPKASKDSRFSLNKTSSFQIGFQLINEENVPAHGIEYAIRFQTGEELTFRARRIFLPSMCAIGDRGASCSDVPLLDFAVNA